MRCAVYLAMMCVYMCSCVGNGDVLPSNSVVNGAINIVTINGGLIDVDSKLSVSSLINQARPHIQPSTPKFIELELVVPGISQPRPQVSDTYISINILLYLVRFFTLVSST